MKSLLQMLKLLSKMSKVEASSRRVDRSKASLIQCFRNMHNDVQRISHGGHLPSMFKILISGFAIFYVEQISGKQQL